MRRLATGLAAGLVTVALMGPAAAQTATTEGEAGAVGGDVVSVSEILSNHDIYGIDNTAVRVTVEGELIGDYGHRSGGDVWTQLNDDAYARDPLVDGGDLAGSNLGIGVRIPGNLMEGVDPPGGYRLRGPLVRVTGDWRYHDESRSGESFLDVVSLEVVEPGRVLQDDPHLGVLAIGLALLAVAGMVWLRVRAAGKPD